MTTTMMMNGDDNFVCSRPSSSCVGPKYCTPQG
jgi:hypothetical protein